MKTLPIAEVKTHLSAILKEVESGSEIAISSGKRKETIAVIIPFDVYQKTKKRALGSLKGKVSVEFKSDFKMTDKELISS
jgi:antitoxin (DNA-binding transcriptional repressor) of toxin-antitoxin stability system